MKKIIYLFFCIYLTNCYFGANENAKKLPNNFFLLGWDERDWIAYSRDNENLYEEKKIIINHDVVAVGHNNDFIIVKQKPCQNKKDITWILIIVNQIRRLHITV